MSADGNYKLAGLYNFRLKVPPFSTIRRNEEQAITALIHRYADNAQRVLEIGPGTGYYTLELARNFREVVAVEYSAKMTEILAPKLQAEQVQNVELINGNFLALPLEAKFDVAIAIGVLDYISDPAAFVNKMCALARRAVIFTAPQRGFWGACFAGSSRLFNQTKVFCYKRTDPHIWVSGWRGTVTEVGLKTPLTRGLTLVAALEPQSIP